MYFPNKNTLKAIDRHSESFFFKHPLKFLVSFLDFLQLNIQIIQNEITKFDLVFGFSYS